jgi:hypothetical protein
VILGIGKSSCGGSLVADGHVAVAAAAAAAVADTMRAGLEHLAAEIIRFNTISRG